VEYVVGIIVVFKQEVLNNGTKQEALTIKVVSRKFKKGVN
jgi:hypothetical protein